MTGGDALFRLDGAVAVVIGGGGALGGAMASGLARAGACVVLADLPGSGAPPAAERLAAEGLQARPAEVDVTSSASVDALVEGVERDLGPIEILVNSAGITHRAPAVAFPEKDWQRVLAVNLTGVFLACQAAGRGMVARGRGAIVNIASIAGAIGLPGTIAYTATKGGVIAMTRALAVEWADTGVRVNAIAPSWFSSNMGTLIHREPGYADWAMRRVPFHRLGAPDELAGAVVFLASPASSMVTGHVLAVDGGTLAS